VSYNLEIAGNYSWNTAVKSLSKSAAFGDHAQGELYILAFDGKIHRLVPR
jgi:hypothetical protein